MTPGRSTVSDMTNSSFPRALPLSSHPIDGVNFEGIFTLCNLTDADRIVKFILDNKPERALVVGAGFIGLELVENLKRLGMEVTLVEMLNQVLPAMDPEMTRPIEAELEQNGVNLMLGEQVTAFERKKRLRCQKFERQA